MTSTTRVIQVYKSRRTLIDLLAAQGFDTSEYVDFSVNEIDTMYNNSQLDMLMTRESDGQKVYVKYHSSPAPKNINTALDNVIEDLYSVDEVLTPSDILVIVTDDDPKDTTVAKLKYLFDNAGIFVVMHNIKRLQFNILEHVLVPRTEVLTPAEKAEFMREYRVADASQLPEISRFDPHALALCVRPGQICRIYRNSETALQTVYYRMCVQ
jgi:DNA-directed RNA polymerase subunit H